jgi:hypothetical protein
MPHHNQSSLWKPGQSGNPAGRPADARRPRTKEVIELIKSLGHKDPLETLSELQNNSQDEAIRATAANMLAPYLHSKLASTPVPPPPQYFEEAVNLPRPTSIREAYENIALLSEYKATGKIDITTANSLIEDQRVILNAMVDEAKLLTAQGGSPEQTIYIEGGLPKLPGTDVIMPPTRMNGKDAIEPEPNPGQGSPPEADPPGSTEP